MSGVINNLNLLDSAFRPFKANTPLAIDANAMLAFSVFLQGLQLVLRRNSEISQITGPIEHGQFAQSHRFNIDPVLNAYALKQLLGITTLKADDHVDMVT